MRKTIGKMTKSRAVWAINPVTRVKKSKQKYPNRQQAKVALRKGNWDD